MSSNIDYQRAFSHCPLCGGNGLGGEANRFQCAQCGQVFFQNVAAASGALIERDGKLLVLRRGKEPGKGKLGFPGGFVDAGESLEHSVIREIAEEVGLQAYAPRYLCSGSNEYWYQEIQYFTSDVFFICSVKPGEPVLCPTEVAGVEWRTPAELLSESFAFESHREALQAYIKQRC